MRDECDIRELQRIDHGGEPSRVILGAVPRIAHGGATVVGGARLARVIRLVRQGASIARVGAPRPFRDQKMMLVQSGVDG